MTDNNHSITPPPELVQQWWDGTHGAFYEFEAVVTQAARWGADQELKACCEWLDDTDCDDPQEVTQLLRAALAEPEPEGPTDQEIEEWADACYEVPPMELDVYGWRLYFTAEEFSKTIRAALARWGNHPGFPDSSAADGEMAGIVEWLKKRRRLADLGTKDWYFRAAELLEQLSPPQPVPVSERLPGPGDCDEEGRCWLCGKVEGDWRLLDPNSSGVPRLKYCFSHWLPAHALPLPS